MHDNGQVVLEFEQTGAGDLDGNDLSNRYLWGPAVDQLLADEQVDWSDYDADGEVLWALTDHLGSVRDVVDSNGDLRVHRNFDAFGNIVADTHYNGSGAVVTAGQTGFVDEAFAFTGRYFDKDTSLQNNLNRWYDPGVGRWLSEDPIGFEAGDANLYRYVGNEPTNFTDPTGMWRWFGWFREPESEGGASEWGEDMLPHVVDGAIEAAGHAGHMETPGVVGIGMEAAHAATELAPTVIIKCTTEKDYHDALDQAGKDPNNLQKQHKADKAYREWRDQQNKAHELQHEKH